MGKGTAGRLLVIRLLSEMFFEQNRTLRWSQEGFWQRVAKRTAANIKKLWNRREIHGVIGRSA